MAFAREQEKRAFFNISTLQVVNRKITRNTSAMNFTKATIFIYWQIYKLAGLARKKWKTP